MSQPPDNPDVYMSGPLSAPSEGKVEYLKGEIYERVYNLCDEMELSCYCPHMSKTDPSNRIAHGEVWDIDFQKVTSADVLIAYIGIPSLGVGAEIEMARAANNDIILLAEFQKQDDLSRLVLGNPAVKNRLFYDDDSIQEIEGDIKRDLFEVFSKKNLERAAFTDKWDDEKIKEMRNRLIDSTKGPTRGMSEPMSVEDWIDEANDDKDGKSGSQSTLT